VFVGARVIALAVLAASTTAPFQCVNKAGPALAFEEEPAEGLYALAEHFKAAGDQKARAETLAFLVKRYPSSRFAVTAQQDLDTAPELKGLPGAK
jgi:hypothetical protein